MITTLPCERELFALSTINDSNNQNNPIQRRRIVPKHNMDSKVTQGVGDDRSEGQSPNATN
eukprot:905840-Amphidinium_carterae.1